MNTQSVGRTGAFAWLTRSLVTLFVPTLGQPRQHHGSHHPNPARKLLAECACLVDFMPGMPSAVDEHYYPRDATQGKAPPFRMYPEEVLKRGRPARVVPHGYQ